MSRLEERLTSLAVALEGHTAREEAILQEMQDLRGKVDEMHSIHTQAKGGIRLIILVSAAVPVVYGALTWFRDVAGR